MRVTMPVAAAADVPQHAPNRLDVRQRRVANPTQISAGSRVLNACGMMYRADVLFLSPRVTADTGLSAQFLFESRHHSGSREERT